MVFKKSYTQCSWWFSKEAVPNTADGLKRSCAQCSWCFSKEAEPNIVSDFLKKIRPMQLMVFKKTVPNAAGGFKKDVPNAAGGLKRSCAQCSRWFAKAAMPN